MKTIALKENNPAASALELSTFEWLKSFHFGRAVGVFEEGVVKLVLFYFSLSYYQFIWGYEAMPRVYLCKYLARKPAYITFTFLNSADGAG